MANKESATYVGRFAPSPTGFLHEGSMLAALASFIDAKAHSGEWLLRIEDVDLLRRVTGSYDQIRHALERHGLQWDKEVVFQSQRETLYHDALQALIDKNCVFYCDCSRNLLKQHGTIYPGFCHNNQQTEYKAATDGQPASHAIRFKLSHYGQESIVFLDRVFGRLSYQPEQLGDFIIRRRDSLFAYQLAVVVDDIAQSISHVVRGRDLIDSTPWQLALYAALGAEPPTYMHLPLIVNASDQAKLSKQTGAKMLSTDSPEKNLLKLLAHLNQPIAPTLKNASVSEILNAAIDSWNPSSISKKNITYKSIS